MKKYTFKQNKEYSMKKYFILQYFFILYCYTKEIVVFVQPFKIFTIVNDEYFYAIQNNKLLGWHEITDKTLFKNSYEEVFLPFVKEYYIYNNKASFFTFNWSGSIFPLRYKDIAPKKLFNALVKYKNNNPDDTIILIAYSHGGNVVLRMADLLRKNNIKIDLVVLLGTPLGESSNSNARNKLADGSYVFSKIINIYSFDDYIQTIDIFFNNFKLCQRTLDYRKNLINYEIKNKGHVNLWYQIFKQDPFVIQVPRIMSALAGDHK